MSFRYRAYPTESQQAGMVQHCGQSRLVWNTALEQMNAAFQRGLRVDWGDWDAELAALRNDREFAWLREQGSSSVQQQALRQLRQAFRNYWSNPAHFGRPKFRAKFRTGDGFVIRDVNVRKLNRKWSQVHVPKIGWVKFRRDRPIGKHGMAHVTRDRQQRWHVSFSTPQTPVKQAEDADTNTVGVDRGITTTAATSNGQLLNIPKPRPKEVKKYRSLQRQKQRQQPGSNRYARTKAEIAKLDGRWAARRKDWVEKTSTKLVAENHLIVFENLNTKQMMKSASGTVDDPGVNVAAKRGLNRVIAQSCWGMLATRTRQKAEATGVAFIEVPAAYTSQKCCRCGHTDPKNRSNKLFQCASCGHTADADTQAACNILADGLAVIRRGEPKRNHETSTLSYEAQAA